MCPFCNFLQEQVPQPSVEKKPTGSDTPSIPVQRCGSIKRKIDAEQKIGTSSLEGEDVEEGDDLEETRLNNTQTLDSGTGRRRPATIMVKDKGVKDDIIGLSASTVQIADSIKGMGPDPQDQVNYKILENKVDNLDTRFGSVESQLKLILTKLG